MCTVIASWGAGQFLLGMNRDEQSSRVHVDYRDGDIFFPHDPISGGTWLGISKEGRVAALLNNGVKQNEPCSRGEIVPFVLDRKHVRELTLTNYAPFSLFVYNHFDQTAMGYTWDGERLHAGKVRSPRAQTSSQYEVTERRYAHIAELVREEPLSIRRVEKILRDHTPKQGPVSVCMHGKRSETVGSSIIEIKGNQIQFYDMIGSPCSKRTYPLVKAFSLEESL